MLPRYAEVILPIPLPNLLTYVIPDNMIEQCTPGCRVVVPCGKSKLYSGILCNITDKKPDSYEIKEIVELLDQTPVVTPYQIKFWYWIANYYMCTV